MIDRRFPVGTRTNNETSTMSGGSRGVDIDLALRGLPPSMRQKLKAKGFRTDSDFAGLQPLELAAGGFFHPSLLAVF